MTLFFRGQDYLGEGGGGCGTAAIFCLPGRGVFLQDAVEAAEERAPVDGAEVEFMLVVEVDGAEGAACGTHADVVAGGDAGVAVEGLAIKSKGVDVLVIGFWKVVTGFHLVDLVLACAGGVCAGTHEDLDAVNT